MALLTQTRYDQILDFLYNKAVANIGDWHVFKTPYYFASAQDFAAVVNNTNEFEKGYKVKYLVFNFGQEVDSKTKGCDEDPNYMLYFLAQLYHTVDQTKDGRDDSHTKVVRKMIDLRNAFLIGRTIEAGKIEHTGLIQVGDMINVQECQLVVGNIGNWINFRIGVEVNAE